jgi:hypothetical protein
MDMEMFACNSDKEQIVNDIKELKQQIIHIENKLDELRVFYITNKGKYDHELARTFFKNLKDFINKERIETWGLEEDPYFINYYSHVNKKIIVKYLVNSECVNRPNTPKVIKSIKQQTDKLFNIIYNEEEDKLLHKMLMFEKKLKYYENRLIRLYPDCEKP